MNRHFIDYNAIPAPYVAMSDPAKTPSQIAAELEEQRRIAQAEDAKAYAGMKAPPAAKPRDPAYQPKEFGYAHVDHKGHQGEVIPKRPASTFKDREQAAFEEWLYRVKPGGDAESVHDQWRKSLERLEFLEQEDEPESIITPLAPSKPAAAEVPEGATHRCRTYGTYYRHIKTGNTYIWGPNGWQEAYGRWSDEAMASGGFERLPQPAAPTEWQDGPPPEKGWREVDIDPGTIAYFDGDAWTFGYTEDQFAAGSFGASKAGVIANTSDRHQVDSIKWRGPLLTGADWPEPAAS